MSWKETPPIRIDDFQTLIKEQGQDLKALRESFEKYADSMDKSVAGLLDELREARATILLVAPKAHELRCSYCEGQVIAIDPNTNRFTADADLRCPYVVAYKTVERIDLLFKTLEEK